MSLSLGAEVLHVKAHVDPDREPPQDWGQPKISIDCHYCGHTYSRGEPDLLVFWTFFFELLDSGASVIGVIKLTASYLMSRNSHRDLPSSSPVSNSIDPSPSTAMSLSTIVTFTPTRPR